MQHRECTIRIFGLDSSDLLFKKTRGGILFIRCRNPRLH